MRFPIRFPISPTRSLSLCFLAGAVLPAHAQTEIAPIEIAPAEIAPAAQNNLQNNAGAPPALPDLPQNPPQKAVDKEAEKEARNAARRAQNELRLRAMMSDFGIDETGKQDALIAYLAEDEAGRNVLRDAARRLMNAVKRGATPERTRDLIAVYKASLDADHERRRAAQGALDAKIGFSLSPRLEATLWLFGVLGEGQAGLPLSVLIPRAAKDAPKDSPKDAPAYGAPENARNDVKNRANAARRAGIVTGKIAKKGEGWIEVRDDNYGNIERFLPFWTAPNAAPQTGPDGQPLEADGDIGNLAPDANTAYNRAILEAIKAVKVGDHVRLEWVWNERKRIIRLTPIPLPIETAPIETAPAEIAPAEIDVKP